MAALRHSWARTRGNGLKLFKLLLIVVGSGTVQPIETVLTSVVSLMATVGTIGILSEAFYQLRADA